MKVKYSFRPFCFCIMACLTFYGFGQFEVQAAFLGDMKADNILFLGNSITLAGTYNNMPEDTAWGAAASERSKDYVHLLTSSIGAATGDPLDLTYLTEVPDRWYFGYPLPNYEGNILNIADIFERNFNTWDNARIQPQLDAQPDIVVLQFGENLVSGENATPAQLATALNSLLTELKNTSNPNIFITSYILGSNPTIDAIKQQACAADPSHRFFVNLVGLSDNTGYAGHPTDAGMQTIADTIFASMVAHSEYTAPTSLTSGLAGYWRFEAVTADGYYLDESGSGNHCLAGQRNSAGATPSDPSIISGVAGNAIHVGADEFVHTMNLSPVSGSDARSYNIWFKPDSIQHQTAMSAGIGGTNGSIFEICLENSGIYCGHFWYAFTLGTPDPAYTPGEWNMATLVYDGNREVSVYKNGQLVESCTMPFVLNTSETDICFGGSNANGSTDMWDYEGSIDEAALWSRALTADEVAALYTLGMQGSSILPATPKIPGDTNNDGRVDGSDVTILAGNWQMLNGATWAMGDFNGDGRVDGSDVTILAGNWQSGVNTTAVAVPEPGTMLLIFSAIIGLLIWKPTTV